MLDTSTCIYAMKRTPGFNAKLPLHDCGISIIVLGELEWGAWLSNRMKQSFAAVKDFTAGVQVVDLDADVVRQYGQLRVHLRRPSRRRVGHRWEWRSEYRLPFRRLPQGH